MSLVLNSCIDVYSCDVFAMLTNSAILQSIIVYVHVYEKEKEFMFTTISLLVHPGYAAVGSK